MNYLEKALMAILDVETVKDYNQLMDNIWAAARKKEEVKIDTLSMDRRGRYAVTINDVVVAEILSFSAAKFLWQLLRDVLSEEGFEVL